MKGRLGKVFKNRIGDATGKYQAEIFAKGLWKKRYQRRKLAATVTEILETAIPMLIQLLAYFITFTSICLSL
jgi:hypothetical protein